MKIKITQHNKYWFYNINESLYTQEQFDYIFKYLDFEKLGKDYYIFFNDKKTEEWFNKTYINNIILELIYHYSPKGYEWLKDNWGNGVFKTTVFYPDKQEFKTIVNKIINVRFCRKN